LIKVVERAAEISNRPFTVIDGARTIAEQRENVRKGASKTMRSRHVIAKNGYSHAVDIVIIEGGRALWDACEDVRRPMMQAARELGIPLEWGGSWKSFQDTPHFQLPWKEYPGELPTRMVTSRTAQGSVAAAGAGAVGLFSAAQDALGQVQQAHDQISAGTVIGIVTGVVIVAGALYALYARWDDAGRPLPSFLRPKLAVPPPHAVNGDEP
jgi:peptidoglycan L-alanyl-D-glutamate endopeptidase CwlK